MADKRMFSKSIIDKDSFLDLPISTQALYFHLCMRADDEGFINNSKSIIRNIGARKSDLDKLINEKFVFQFDSGVVLIKDWKIHNYIPNDRYKQSNCIERELVGINSNKEYTISLEKNNNSRIQNVCKMDTTCIHSVDKTHTNCIQPVDKMDTQIRLDKIKLDKEENRKEEINKEEKKKETEPSKEDSGQSIYSPLPFTQFLIDNKIIENEDAQVVPINISIYRFKDKFTNDQLKTVANEIYKEIVIKELTNMDAVNYFKINFKERMSKLEHENR